MDQLVFLRSLRGLRRSPGALDSPGPPHSLLSVRKEIGY
eukprot:COSAG04_NODE_5611_length_1553_cov_1.251719_3_plen_38_part_01